MSNRSFIGNKGLCGGLLGFCLAPPPQDTKERSSRLRKTVAIISAAIGRVSLILIVVIIYFMTRPVDNVAPLQDKASSSFVSDVYFSPKEGFSF